MVITSVIGKENVKFVVCPQNEEPADGSMSFLMHGTWVHIDLAKILSVQG